jgi:hypothetical protein
MPLDRRVGSFARECQVPYLADRFLKHVYESCTSVAFYQNEAIQLEQRLMTLVPILVEEEEKFGLHCAALGMCTK